LKTTNIGSSQNRDQLIDLMKGFAILLVVLGHSIQFNSANFDDNILFRIIYSFHMPFFMFVSGWVATFNKSGKLHLKKRFNRLVIPFIAWYVLSFILYGEFHTVSIKEFVKRVIIAPDYGLWFLWVLFLCYIFLFLSIKLQKYIGWFSLVIVMIVIHYIPLFILGFSLLKWYFFFFALGFFIGSYKNLFLKYKNYLGVVSLIIFPFLVVFWHRIDSTASIVLYLQGFIRHQQIIQVIITVYSYAVPLSGIFLLIFILSIFIRGEKISRILTWLGLYTLDIYAIHFNFVGKVGLGSGWLRIVTAFIFTFILTLIVSQLLRKVKILRRIFLGA
jgi:fucose 4-O-acetylase-like acetyltransferase